MSDNSIIKNIDELISTIDQDFDNFENLLDQITADIVKTPKHVSSFISYINTKLSDAPTRKRGLLLLNTFIPLCPHNLCVDNAIAWINNSLKYCERETFLQNDAYDIITQLLNVCIEIPELNKEITSGILNKINEQIITTHYNSQNCTHTLNCMETCLRLYSGSCGQFKNAIEKYLITFVDCNSSGENVRLAGKCLHALQQTGGGGIQGINHKKHWKIQQESLCATVHVLMNELFESVIELSHMREKEDVVPLTLPKLPIGEPMKLITRRIINVTIFLQEMLLGAYPTPKSVIPNLILQTIIRGLNITSSTIRNTIVAEAIYLSLNLYLIHKCLLQLLQALIICLGNNLIPFAVRVSKLIMNNLKCTSSKEIENVNLYCDLQVVTYQTLCLWMDTTKSASCVDELAESLLPILTKNITPMKSELSLMVQNPSSKVLSKKAKRKSQQDQIINSSMTQTYGPTSKKQTNSSNMYQHKLCSQALIVLRSLLNNASHLLKPTVHKQLQQFVVKTLFEIQRGITVKPYDNIDCKLELYKTLSCLVYNHHYNMSPPLSYAVLLLSKGQSDYDPQISSFCTTAVANLNIFIHPAFATLQIPLDLENIHAELNEKEEEIPIISCIEIMEVDNEPDEIIVENEAEKIDQVPDKEAEVNAEENNTDKPKENISNECNENDLVNKNESNSVNTIDDNSDTILINSSENTKEIETENQVNESEDIIDITPIEDSSQNKLEKLNNNKQNDKFSQTTNKNSSKSSYSVQIEILSDDEVMEQLTINDDPEFGNEITENNTINKNNENNKVEEKKKTTDDNIINLEEEDMCSAFVNIVKE